MQETLASHRTNNFDFLRLLAATMVIFGHSYLLLGKPDQEPLRSLTNQWTFDEIAVYIFFAISGYLITASYCNRPRAFWRSRVLRIFPALLVNLLLTMFLLGPLLTSLPWKDYFTNVETYRFPETIFSGVFKRLPGVFENNHTSVVNGSLWTLYDELRMYFLIWCMGKTGLNFKKTVPVVIAIFLLIILCKITLDLSNHQPVDLSDLSHVKLSLIFMIGSAFYIYREHIAYNPKILALLLTAGFAATIIGLADFVTYICLPYTIFYFAFSKTIKLNQTACYGDFSYGIYIYAFPVQQVLLMWSGDKLSPLQLFLQTLAITLVLAAASWHLVEKRALTWKKNPAPSQKS